ncbi:MAG: hypothetical protein DMF63_07135 [Acidobacteria bacterium]|nr:MAG: hypothetical protein DMF63_07135 [Acidobacteriota bacterium]
MKGSSILIFVWLVGWFLLAALQTYILKRSQNPQVNKWGRGISLASAMLLFFATVGAFFEIVAVLLSIPAIAFLIVANFYYRIHCNDCGTRLQSMSHMKSLYSFCDDCAKKHLYS